MKNFCKFIVALGFLLTVPAFYLFAQVGINADNTAPDNSAMLDVQSTTKGMLMPRMTSALRAAIGSPVNGLMVYQTDGASGVYYYNGSLWQRIGEADGSETKVTAGANVTVTGTGTLVSPYVINASGGGSSGHYIGELYQGGIVVAVWKIAGVEKGLIASLVNMQTSGALSTMAWSGNTSVLIGPTAQSPRNGQANTTAIIAQSGGGNTANMAATVCDAYINPETGTGVYSDWYLPAAWELNQCYNAAIVVNAIIGDANGFQNSNYWSSTEYNNTSAWDYSFYYGYADYNGKSGSYWVRAVRAF